MDRDKRKELHKDSAYHAGVFIGNGISANVQQGTNEAIKGMELFQRVAGSKANVGFEQVKGNLFEYIEAAKFNKNAANIGDRTRAAVTDAIGRPHDAADIELVRDGKVVRSVQAKFSKTQNAAGQDTSAATSVNMQRGDKYQGMQRLVRKQEDYTVNKETNASMSLADKAKELAEKRADSEGVYAEQYRDVAKNLTDELTDDSAGGSGVSSGGTTLEEIQEAAQNPEKYARQFRMQQYRKEIADTSANMAASAAIMSGVISGVTNMFEVLNDKKELKEAIKDVGVDVVKGGARGGITGALSAIFRIGGTRGVIPILTDSSCATVMAAGVIDSGVAIYEYAQGEIDSEQLVQSLQDMVIKSATTIYFTKAAACVFGAANTFIPIAVYTVANYVVASAREIIKNAKLNAAEYDRLAKLNEEATRMIAEFRGQLMQQMESYEREQRQAMQNVLCTFDEAIVSGDNCDAAIYAIIGYANQTGIALQHADFSEFSKAMTSQDSFVLK